MKEPDMYTNAKGRAYSHSLGNCICKIDIQTVAIRSIFISIVLYSVVFIVCMRMHLLSRVCTVYSQTIRVGWIAFYSYHMRMPPFGTLLNLRMICSIIVQSERRCSLFGASDVFNITYMSGKIVSNYDLFKHYNKYFYIAHWSFGVYMLYGLASVVVVVIMVVVVVFIGTHHLSLLGLLAVKFWQNALNVQYAIVERIR